MSKEKVYVYLWPESIEAENAKNYHVIRALYDEDKKSLTFSRSRETLDGNCTAKRVAELGRCKIFRNSKAHMRTFLAQRQNEGDEVCANCVRYFYADDDDR